MFVFVEDAGEAIVSADAQTRELGSNQRAADAPAGITLMGVRLYNPTTGRFLQDDPIYGGSANAYDYCAGDPQNCYDLDGEWSWHGAARSAGRWAWKTNGPSPQ